MVVHKIEGEYCTYRPISQQLVTRVVGERGGGVISESFEIFLNFEMTNTMVNLNILLDAI
jgi:hypothetical protein